jgi:hypothetical protein
VFVEGSSCRSREEILEFPFVHRLVCTSVRYSCIPHTLDRVNQRWQKNIFMKDKIRTVWQTFHESLFFQICGHWCLFFISSLFCLSRSVIVSLSASPSVNQAVYLSALCLSVFYLFLCLPRICPFTCIFLGLYAYVSVCLPVCLPICVSSVGLSICLSLCQPIS